jgi:hypothetical protein
MDENGNYSQRYARNRPSNPVQPNTPLIPPNYNVEKSRTFGGRKKNLRKKKTKRRKYF